MRVPVVGLRQDGIIRSLRTGKDDAVHLHLILLGFTPEHGMILEYQATSVGTGFVKFVGGNEACEPATDNDQIVEIVDHYSVGNSRFVNPVANAMGCSDDGGDIPIRTRVITYPRIAVPL